MVNRFLFSLLLLSIAQSSAQSVEQPKETKPSWVKPTPVFSQKFDWLKLTSDEWLKGDIIIMYDDELEFDSDEFGRISFDWEDVAELRSRYDKDIRLADGRVVSGFLIIKDGRLTLISGGTEQHFPLNNLLSITSSADERRNLWSFEISAGIDFSRGNTEQVNYLISANAQRSTPFSRLKADVVANYTQVTIDDIDTATVDSSRFTFSWDWFYTADVFFRVVDYENVTDLQQNIKYRNTLGASLGYHIVNNKRIQWDVTLGPSYQFTEYHSEAAADSEQSGAIAFSALFDYKISRKIEYILDYQLQFVSDEAGQRNHHLKTGFEFDFINDFDFDLLFYLDRIAKPAITVSSTIPEKNDYRLAFSIKYKY